MEGGMRRASVTSAVALLLVSLGIAFFAAAFNVFAVDAVAESRISEAGPGDWIGDPQALQWDILTGLGLTGATAAVGAVVACIRARRFALAVSAVTWTVLQASLWHLVSHASANTAGDLLFWQLAGVALLIAAVVMVPPGLDRLPPQDR
jgi:hypothetical protein